MALIYPESRTALAGWSAMEKIWGPIDFLSEGRAFDFTHYYEKEMGRSLTRRWAAFKNLVPQQDLPEIKWQALELEKQWCTERGRRLNIDPGFITAERLVLSTGKNYSHRIYLARGIFADLTLLFHNGSYQPLPWTYPDYRDEASLRMFNKIREKYFRDVADCGMQTAE